MEPSESAFYTHICTCDSISYKIKFIVVYVMDQGYPYI